MSLLQQYWSLFNAATSLLWSPPLIPVALILYKKNNWLKAATDLQWSKNTTIDTCRFHCSTFIWLEYNRAGNTMKQHIKTTPKRFPTPVVEGTEYWTWCLVPGVGESPECQPRGNHFTVIIMAKISVLFILSVCKVYTQLCKVLYSGKFGRL